MLDASNPKFRLILPDAYTEERIEPDAIFGQIKECGRFRRLRLRGLTGARIEFGLKALVHNLRLSNNQS